MAKVRVFQDAKQKAKLGARRCPWSVEWRQNGKRKSKTLGTKDDANDYAAIKRAELLDREKGITTRKKWEEFVAEYVKLGLEATGKRPATIDLVRLILDKFTEIVNPQWVAKIDAKSLDEYCRERLRQKGQRGGNISPATIRKELRHLHAALSAAKRWDYLREVPSLPRIAADEREKIHVTEEHFLAMLRAADTMTMPDSEGRRLLPDDVTAGDWWKALIVVLWATGARIGAVLRLRWSDLDRSTGRVLSRAADLKQRKDTRPVVAVALPWLDKIKGSDPRMLPWNHSKRTLYEHFAKLQKAAGISLPCKHSGEIGHECTDGCRLYGFHSFRYAHARLNFDNPELQQQMGHATTAMTEHYRKWGQRQAAQYQPYMPAELLAEQDGGKEVAQQRENGESESGKPALRVVCA